jgi:hypothetical protein
MNLPEGTPVDVFSTLTVIAAISIGVVPSCAVNTKSAISSSV